MGFTGIFCCAAKVGENMATNTIILCIVGNLNNRDLVGKMAACVLYSMHGI